jgi:hypothetical protein
VAISALRAALLALALCGCAQGLDDPGTARLTDRVWLDTGGDAAPGSFRAFLSDGTLVMASCVETYRLARWRRDGGGVAWEEDGAEVRADVAAMGPDTLVLVLELTGGPDTRRYRAAAAPVTCGD